MMYIVEGYPEFKQDVKEIWNDFINDNNFNVVQIDNDSIELRNSKCIIQLDLNVGERIYYCFQNPETLKVTDYITLEIYFGRESLKKMLGNKCYPLKTDEWMDFYLEDNYRSICRVDLPIVLDEIKENFKFVIDGDFSWEKNIDKWQEWYDANYKSGVPYHYKELTYEHFLKDKGKKG